MFSRMASLKIADGADIPLNFDSMLDLKFHVKYTVNQVYGGADISICGLNRTNAMQHIQVLAKGLEMAKADKKVVTLKAGYQYGEGAKCLEIYKGTSYNAVVSGTPDVWLNMHCMTQYVEVNMFKQFQIKKKMKLETACKEICRVALEKPCMWAVKNPEAMKMEIDAFNSVSMLDTKVETVRRKLEELGGGLIRCYVEDKLNFSPMIIMDRDPDQASIQSVMGMVGVEQKQFSCLGEPGMGVVYGIPQPTYNGIELDVQLDPTIRRWQLFTVNSKMVPVVNGRQYVITAYEHKGHLRGQEWKTHIKGIVLDGKAYMGI